MGAELLVVLQVVLLEDGVVLEQLAGVEDVLLEEVVLQVDGNRLSAALDQLHVYVLRYLEVLVLLERPRIFNRNDLVLRLKIQGVQIVRTGSKHLVVSL